MRRRRIAFMLRAMVMTVPSIVTMCGSQTRTDEERVPPPAIEKTEAARAAGQPIGGIAVKGSQNPQLKARITREVSARENPRATDAR